MDIRQFAYAGIDVYGLLSDYLGVSTAEIQEMQSKGKITYDMLSGALKNATKEGGRFNGAMEKQSHTLNGMISNFKDNVGNLAGDLSSGFTDAIKNILPPINNMIDRIDTLLKNNTRFVEFSKNIANVFKIIGDAIDRLSDDQLNSIIDMFVALAKTGPLLLGLGSILPKVGGAIDLFLAPTSGIVGFLKQLTKGIPVVQQVVNVLGTMIAPIMGVVSAFFKLGVGLTAIVGVLGFVNEQTGGKLQEMANKFKKYAPIIVKQFVDNFVASLPSIIEQGQNILTSLITGLSNMLPSLVTMIDSLLNAIISTLTTNGPQIAELVTNAILKITQSLYESTPGFTNAVFKIVEGIMRALRDNLPQILVIAKETSNETIQVISDNLPEFIGLGSEVIMALIQGLVDQIPALIDEIPQMVNLMVNAFLGMSYLFAQVGYKLIQALIQGIKNVAVNLPNVANQIMTNTKNTLLNWLGQFLQIGTRLIQSLGQGARNQVWNVVSTARNLAWNVVNAFSGMNLWSTGYNLLSGLWNGISSKTSWVLSKVRGVANSILKVVRNVFRIGSPSKEFAYFGEMNMEGLSIGMASQEKEIQSQIDGMFNLQPNISPMMTIQRESEDYSSAFTNAINNMQERPVVIDVRADEGIIVQKATQGFREFQRANGRLPF